MTSSETQRGSDETGRDEDITRKIKSLIHVVDKIKTYSLTSFRIRVQSKSTLNRANWDYLIGGVLNQFRFHANDNGIINRD